MEKIRDLFIDLCWKLLIIIIEVKTKFKYYKGKKILLNSNDKTSRHLNSIL